MATAVDTERITAAEFFHHLATNGPSELVHGDVCVDAHALGGCFFDGTGFALPPRDDTVRSPDVAFVSAVADVFQGVVPAR